MSHEKHCSLEVDAFEYGTALIAEGEWARALRYALIIVRGTSCDPVSGCPHIRRVAIADRIVDAVKVAWAKEGSK